MTRAVVADFDKKTWGGTANFAQGRLKIWDAVYPEKRCLSQRCSRSTTIPRF